MTIKTTYRALTLRELTALSYFAQAHGRCWKQELSMIYWYNARPWNGPHGTDHYTGSLIHGLRNTLGPDWLDRYDLNAACDAAGIARPMARGKSVVR